MTSRSSKKAVPLAPDVLTISEAAEVLGVCEMTLRRWDAAGKFRAHRHPVSGYRLYRRELVLKLRSLIDGGRAK